MITKIKDKVTFYKAGANELNGAAVDKLSNASRNDLDVLWGIVNSNIEGLTEDQIEERRDQFGLNEIAHEQAPAWYKQLLEAFLNPFIGVLIVIGIVSLVTDVIIAKPGEEDYTSVIILSIMVLLSSLLRFWQEFTSNKAAQKLKNMVTTTATILRQGAGKKEIDIKEIVPGDIIFLSAGDMIPADCRIIQSKDLFISQSMLTGEALPVEKREYKIDDADKKSSLELENICFMGTNVVSGTAIAVAITTGNETYFGSTIQ